MSNHNLGHCTLHQMKDAAFVASTSINSAVTFRQAGGVVVVDATISRSFAGIGLNNAGIAVLEIDKQDPFDSSWSSVWQIPFDFNITPIILNGSFRREFPCPWKLAEWSTEATGGGEGINPGLIPLHRVPTILRAYLTVIGMTGNPTTDILGQVNIWTV